MPSLAYYRTNVPILGCSLIVAASRRPLFGPLEATALNDAGAPPFAAYEADEEEEGRADDIDLAYELAPHAWRAIDPGAPPHDAPVRFIDGSVFTRTAGSLLVAFRRRPMIAAVVSAASLVLDGRTTRRGAGAQARKLLCLYNDGIDPAVLSDARDRLADAGIALYDRESQQPLGDFDAMRRQTRSLAMEVMENAEKAVLFAAPQTPTLVDGLLERRLAAMATHDLPAVGLVKRQMTQYLPMNLQEMLYTLKPGQRTPAFVLKTVQHVDIVNTYVRLSAQAGTSPSYGVVRLTAPLAYVERAHASDRSEYLSGLAAYVHRLRHRDLAYGRSGISVEPIVRVEDHLHAILPDVEVLVRKLHHLFNDAKTLREPTR